MKCPTCNSPEPHLHPAVQCEGEIHVCTDDFHMADTPQAKRYHNDIRKARAEARDSLDVELHRAAFEVIAERKRMSIERLGSREEGVPNYKYESTNQAFLMWLQGAKEARRLTLQAGAAIANNDYGYREAFYEIAKVMNIGAMPVTPKYGFEKVMLPRIRGLVDALHKIEGIKTEPWVDYYETANDMREIARKALATEPSA